jgi:hypothetical protein
MLEGSITIDYSNLFLALGNLFRGLFVLYRIFDLSGYGRSHDLSSGNKVPHRSSAVRGFLLKRNKILTMQNYFM